MKTLTKLTLAAATLVAAITPAAANPSKPTTPAATIVQVEKTLGFVPQFVRAIPQVLLTSWWDGTMSLEMNPNTKLNNKTKELIALAVAAQIPCEYCVLFHTEAARLNGATDEELQEAVGMAALARAGSTLLNGMQVDKAQFKRDVDRIVRGARQAAKK